jgi:hypothetical protein
LNPDLVKATRSLLAAQAAAQKAGQTISDSDLEAYMREETKGKFGYADAKKYADKLHADGGNSVASALQGFTANFGDELVGMLPSFLGGGEAGKEEMRLRGDMMRREHPVGDAALQGLGAAGSAAVMPIGKLAEGATMAARALQGGRVGAVYGGLNGAGAGEDLKSRAIGGAAGTVVGGIVGEAVPHLVDGVKSVAAPIANLFSKAPAAAAADLSMLPNRAPVTQIVSPLERASAGVQKAIDEMGGFAKVREANAAHRAAGTGDIVRLANLGKPFTKAADFAANNSEAAHNAISDVVDEHSSNITQKVIDNFKGAVGDAHAPSRQADLASDTRAWADGPAGYGGIRENNPTVPLGDADPLVSQPRVKSLWADAKATGQIGSDPELSGSDAMTKLTAMNPNMDSKGWSHLLENPDVVAQLRAAGQGHVIDAIQKGDGHTFNNVQDLMHSLQDASESAFQGGKNNLGFKMKDAASVVQKTLEEHVPGYAQISASYAERKGLERALEAGGEWFHKSADVTGLNNFIKTLTPAELEQARYGMASEQIIALQGKDGANAATKTMIAKNNPARQNLLKVMFGDEATFDSFMEKAKALRQISKLGDVVGGSQTHARGAASKVALADELGPAAELMKPTSLGLKHKVSKMAWDHTIGPVLERRADKMTPQLLTQGSDAIDELLARMEANAPQGPGAGATKLSPAAISSLFGSQYKP